MKYTIYSILAATLLFTACSQQEDPETTAAGRVPLQVEVAGVSTRAAIQGSTLPEGSRYGTFVMQSTSNSDFLDNGRNVSVSYSGGTSKMSNTVYLDDYQAKVLAYYPYDSSNSNPGSISVYSGTTDYLYGGYIDSNSSPLYVDEDQPKATITLRHALARVRFIMHKAADNDSTYRFSNIQLHGYTASATVSLLRQTVTPSTRTTSTGLNGTVYFNTLSNAGDSIEAEYLMVPMSIRDVSIAMSGTKSFTAYIPAGHWESGHDYTYYVTIDKGQNIRISQAVINEWRDGGTGKEMVY